MKVEIMHPGLGARASVHWKAVPHLKTKGWVEVEAPPVIDLSGLLMTDLRKVARAHGMTVPRGTDKETLVGMVESLLTNEGTPDGKTH